LLDDAPLSLPDSFKPEVTADGTTVEGGVNDDTVATAVEDFGIPI
jgi:hypothetical protein